MENEFKGICQMKDIVCCRQPLEKSLHAIRDCGFSKAAWKVVIPNSVITIFFSANLHVWL